MCIYTYIRIHVEVCDRNYDCAASFTSELRSRVATKALAMLYVITYR